MGNQQGSAENKDGGAHVPSIFISYNRTDKLFVRNLHDALAPLVSNVWVDWEVICSTLFFALFFLPIRFSYLYWLRCLLWFADELGEQDVPLSAEWLKELHKGIEQSDVVICVLSPEGIKSETCHFQLEHAVTCGKRLVPVVCLDVDYREVSKHLSALNWIFFRTGVDDFNAAMLLLTKAINTDVEHMHAHTRILCRAVQWEENRFDKSLLLKGQDSQDAVQWLYRCAMGTAPFATPLMLSLIQASAKLPTTRGTPGRQSIIGPSE
jgi:hypothetical protein